MIPFILAGLFFLSSCAPGTPAAPTKTTPATIAPTPRPTEIAAVEVPAITSTPMPTDVPTIPPTPTPTDVVKYWNTFDDVADPMASGITPVQDYGNVKTSTDNVD